MSNFIDTYTKPYYAVIFSSNRNYESESNGNKDYELMAERMIELAYVQKGFLGVESVRHTDGFGITISYWQSEEDIRIWKAHAEHRIAQILGRKKWYEKFVVRICKVERDYHM